MSLDVAACLFDAKFEADAVQAIGVSRREDHVGSLATSKPGRFESDARAAADHDDGLSGEFRLAAHAVAPTFNASGTNEICSLLSSLPYGTRARSRRGSDRP